jgi:hypothetical protein
VNEVSNTAVGGVVAGLAAAIAGDLAEAQFGTASTTDLLKYFSEGGLATMRLAGTAVSWGIGVTAYGAVAGAGLTAGLYIGTGLNGAGYAIVAFVGGD